MDAITAIHTRRSIRDYLPRTVERSLVEDILWDAAQAPTTPASGEEPFAFVVVEGAERIAGYGASALQYAKDHRPPGPGYDWVDRPGFSVFFNAPVVVVVCGWIDSHGQALQDCTRAGQNLMLSAHARRLGACWVGAPMLWVRSETARELLGMPDGYDPFAVLTLGYPAAVGDGRARARPKIVWTGGSVAPR
ncbi:nitroreductase family protein [Arvimicrobium flavum]|uniref:nitroreductase family protein n=1 Tax=Arvimicrobium flavum TaxID=3393320 RepID=UPI00237B0DEF|nr:nitroreductase family protein [Mesorhizobium shangrilense]